MENSTFEAIYTGVYIVVFMAALTITIFLFKTTNDYADLAFEYNERALDESVIINAPVQKFRLINGNEVISYFYNYIKRDVFGDSKTTIEYVVTVRNQGNTPIISSDKNITSQTTLNSTTYSKFVNLINLNGKYVLNYKTVSQNLVYIDITEATQQQIDALV